MVIYCFDKVAKGENASNKHFLLFSQCFQKTKLQGAKSRECVVKGYLFT